MESTLQASRQGADEQIRRRRGGHLAGVGAVTVLVAGIYAVFSLARYYTLQSSSYDLVIFDQAVRSYAHFQPGISVIKGLHNGFGPHFSVLGDHFSPLLAVLAPLYWLHASPQTLLVAQASLFALAIPPLWIFARRAFGGGSWATAAAYLVVGAYGLSWPLASAVAFDFHEVAFAPVLTAVALERLQAGALRTALLALAALLLVKEDMGILVAGIGCYLVLSRPRTVRRQWLVGIALIVAGIAYTAVATYLLIPAFGGRANYYWAYGGLGRNVPQAAWYLVTHPGGAVRMLLAPGVKLDTMAWLAGAFCFLPLLSPVSIAVIPLLLERMLNAKFSNWWVTEYQYNAYLVVVLACAAVDGAARLDRWVTSARQRLASRKGARGPAGANGDSAAGPAGQQRARAPGSWRAGAVAVVCGAAMCAVAVYSVPRFALGAALHASFYQRTAHGTAAAAVAAAVPDGVTVAATNDLGPLLSGRDTVLLWDGDGTTPPLGAPWVVANVRQREFTFSGVTEQIRHVQLLERNGYTVVFRRGGYLVLRRPGPANGAASTAARRAPAR